jgi:hypothetical protein
MEQYIVRIYRRDEINPERVTGILEKVGTTEKVPFHHTQDLMALLVLSGSGVESLARPSGD